MTRAEEPWDLTGDEAARFVAAIQDKGAGIPAGWLLRPGGHCAAKGGLTTLWAYNPRETPDDAGRRPSDINAGTVLTPELAGLVCEAYAARLSAVNSYRRAREDCAAELRALAQDLAATGQGLTPTGVADALSAVANAWTGRT